MNAGSNVDIGYNLDWFRKEPLDIVSQFAVDSSDASNDKGIFIKRNDRRQNQKSSIFHRGKIVLSLYFIDAHSI